MERFADFCSTESLISRISSQIDVREAKSFVEVFRDSVDDARLQKQITQIVEAWYNPMDVFRGAGRWAATRYMGEPKIQHIKELFNSLKTIIDRAGLSGEFKQSLASMEQKLNDIGIGRLTAGQNKPMETDTDHPAAGGFRQTQADAKNPNVPSTTPATSDTNVASHTPGGVDTTPANALIKQSLPQTWDTSRWWNNLRQRRIAARQHRLQNKQRGIAEPLKPAGYLTSSQESRFIRWANQQRLLEQSLQEYAGVEMPTFHKIVEYLRRFDLIPVEQDHDSVQFAMSKGELSSQDWNTLSRLAKEFERIPGYQARISGPTIKVSRVNFMG